MKICTLLSWLGCCVAQMTSSICEPECAAQMLSVLVFGLCAWVSSSLRPLVSTLGNHQWRVRELPSLFVHTPVSLLVHFYQCPWGHWSFLALDILLRALSGSLNQCVMDNSYFYLEVGTFMILSLVYLILTIMGQTHTKYKISPLLIEWEMALLTVRDTDVRWIQVGLNDCEILVWKRICRTLRWETPAERASQKQAAARPPPDSASALFSACQEKTSVNYLNGTLYWRSPELVSSLFNFRKWCHNALNNNAG